MWNQVFIGDLFLVEKHSEKGFERAVRPPGVRLILKSIQGEILLTKEFRSEHNTFDYRLPGGKVFDDIDTYVSFRGDEEKLHTAILEAAKREAKEECGVDEIRNLKIFKKSVAGASVEWDLYYCEGDIVSMSEQELDGDEKEHGIEISFLDTQKIKELIENGHILEDRSIAVLLQYLQKF